MFSLAPVLFVRRRAAPHGRSVGRSAWRFAPGQGQRFALPLGVGGWSRVEVDSMKQGWD